MKYNNFRDSFKYNWLFKKREDIDNAVEDFMDEYEGDIEDEDIQQEIADSIKDIIDSSFGDNCDDDTLKSYITNILIEIYVEYMFSEWYTGDLKKDDYQIAIKKILDV